MYTIKTLNAIRPEDAPKLITNQRNQWGDTDAPDGILVRSADMLNTTFNDNLLAIARAGAGVNNIPLDRCSEQGIVVFNTPGANANAVAELVIGMLIAGSRNVADAAQWCIVVDEVLLNRREDSERLKNLSTTLSYKVEAKGKDRDEIAFFAKFVLCSNNEYLPVIIDAGETRYWVRKIDRLQSDDTDFLQKLKAEIPAFLYYLQYRQLSTEKESRMWFAPSLLHTEALQKIIRSNRNRLEIEMCELILDIMESVGTDTFSFCHNDILLLLVHSQVKVEKHQVRKVLQECWKLTPASNGLTYTTYQFNYNRECRYEPIKRVGRFYTVTREQLESL